MSRKHIFLSAFFDQFITFASELKDMYPDDADFYIFHSTLTLMKTTNPAFVVQQVCDGIKGLEDKIDSKDESFFMSYSSEGYDENIFSKLKNYVSQMNAETKEIVWKYIQNIVKLATAYSA